MPARRRLGTAGLSILATLAVIATLFGVTPGQAQLIPLTGPAYTNAEEAYRAFESGDFATAIAKAREAVRLRPDIIRLKLLLIDSLIAAGEFDQADKEVAEALIRNAGDPELLVRQSTIRQQLARAPATDAYRAIERGDLRAAVAAARIAVQRAPDLTAYRLLLVYSLVADGQIREAFNAVVEAVAQDPDDYVPLVWRAHIQQRLGQRAAAVADFDRVLSIFKLTSEEERNVRLIAADAALAAREPQQALEILRPLSESDAAVAARLRVTREAIARPQAAPVVPLNAPVQDCRATPYVPVCTVAPSPLSATAPANPGFSAAQAAYQAFDRRDYRTAVAEARRAVTLEPDRDAYRLLLINALVAAGDLSEADRSVADGLRRNPNDAELLARRRLVGQHQQPATVPLQPISPAVVAAESAYRAVARRDYATALVQARRAVTLDPANRNYRLLLADAALATKNPAIALMALAPFVGTRSYDVAARRGFVLQALGRNDEALEAFEIALVAARTPVERATARSAQIGILVGLGRKPEAEALFKQARDTGQLSPLRAVDAAYLASRVEDVPTAYEYFERAHAAGQFKGTTYADAAYAAKRYFRNETAIAYFKAAIDANAQGVPIFEPQRLFETRREVAELSRTWGIFASLTHSGVGTASGIIVGPPPTGGRTFQAGAELYWRPPGIGYRNGSIFEVFGRIFQTLHDSTGGPTGEPTTQGAVGARWKPFGDINFILEASRGFAIGHLARNDWLLRTAYSYDHGADLRVDVPNWFTWRLYADLNYYVERPQTITGAELRFGHSFRLDAIDPHFVLFPHVVLSTQYDSLLATPDTLGAGIGSTLRFWFREDMYTAPMSYVDFTLQYRFRLAGDKRIEGVFGQAFVSY